MSILHPGLFLNYWPCWATINWGSAPDTCPKTHRGDSYIAATFPIAPSKSSLLYFHFRGRMYSQIVWLIVVSFSIPPASFLDFHFFNSFPLYKIWLPKYIPFPTIVIGALIPLLICDIATLSKVACVVSALHMDGEMGYSPAVKLLKW